MFDVQIRFCYWTLLFLPKYLHNQFYKLLEATKYPILKQKYISVQ